MFECLRFVSLSQFGQDASLRPFLFVWLLMYLMQVVGFLYIFRVLAFLSFLRAGGVIIFYVYSFLVNPWTGLQGLRLSFFVISCCICSASFLYVF